MAAGRARRGLRALHSKGNMTLENKVLVIGYGNTLRGDDGVGPRVAGGVDSLCLPGVRTLTCQQLSPEHAEPISQADTVVFVDAAVNAPNEVQMRSLEPNESSQIMAHASDPRTMLAIARDVFGRAPKAWWLTIPAVKMEFIEALSPEAQRGLNDAVGRIIEVANTRIEFAQVGQMRGKSDRIKSRYRPAEDRPQKPPLLDSVAALSRQNNLARGSS
jgi:hydrogenase maturation protease